MKKILILFFTACMMATVLAQDAIMDEIRPIQKQWAQIKYNMDEDQQAQAYEQLVQRCAGLVNKYPYAAEPLIWQAIALSSYAGAVGGIKSITRALPAVKQSRELLLDAEQINPNALDGSIYTSLGALYYQVPGWPLGFGDKKRARQYLEKALAISNNDLDAGYFYGDFLVQQHEYDHAREMLEMALAAPARINRPLADQGRRKEINDLLASIKTKS